MNEIFFDKMALIKGKNEELKHENKILLEQNQLLKKQLITSHDRNVTSNY